MATISNKIKYVQFSKRIVVVVTICVTVLCLLSIIFCWIGQNMDAIVSIIKTYIEYAMVVFVSYSGNSAVQKYVSAKLLSVSDDSDQECENG